MAETCKGTNKKGAPCASTSVRDNGYCFAHQPEEVRKSHGFGGPQEGAGRPRKPRAVDVLRERIEANIDRWLRPLEEGLDATRGVVVGDGDSARVEFVDDIPTRIKAHREAFDRAFGRPTQPVKDESFSVDEEIERLLREFDRRDSPNGNGVAHGSVNGHAPR